MSAYEPKLHQEFADLLRRRAKRITLVFTLMAAIVGAGVGMALSRMMAAQHSTMPMILWIVLLGIFGYVAGKERSFNLQLRAHELLCQKQIEENTRSGQMASGTAAR
jgi:fatty acid desaturase